MPLPSLDHPAILETPLQASLDWPDEAACATSARRLALAWTGGSGPSAAGPDGGTITLEGPLGAGKTTFSRHLLQALGVEGRIKSPTYSLVEPYELTLASGPLAAAHCDFYRFEDPSEWEDAGLRELFAGRALRLVEWPRRVGDRLGVVDLELHVDPLVPALPDDAPDADSPVASPRRCRVIAHTARGARWLACLRGDGPIAGLAS